MTDNWPEETVGLSKTLTALRLQVLTLVLTLVRRTHSC